MNTSQNKKVSVVVPNYNYGRYIKKRIDSILKQTYPIYELIVLDDASTDDSIAKCERMIATYGGNIRFRSFLWLGYLWLIRLRL